MTETIMAPTTVPLSDIPADGLHAELDLAPEEIALSADDARVQDGLQVSMDAMKAGTAVEVSGEVALTFVRQCVRCLKEYAEPSRVAFRASYRRGAEPRQAKGEADDAPNAEETYPYQGDAIDLSEMLREQIILATPMQPLCSEACQGLCPVCGRDRNTGACGCVEQREKNAFAIWLERKKDAKSKT